MRAPPPRAIEAARRAATHSTCAKSRRGVAIFRGETVMAVAQNGPPHPFRCGDTPECRASCNMVAVHAEERALINVSARSARHADLVHVKINEDDCVVASREPSCWQCSRMIVSAQIDRVWLLGPDGWRQWGAIEFHRETLHNCDLPVYLPDRPHHA